MAVPVGFEPKVPPSHSLVRGRDARKINAFGSRSPFTITSNFFKCGQDVGRPWTDRDGLYRQVANEEPTTNVSLTGEWSMSH